MEKNVAQTAETWESKVEKWVLWAKIQFAILRLLSLFAFFEHARWLQRSIDRVPVVLRT